MRAAGGQGNEAEAAQVWPGGRSAAPRERVAVVEDPESFGRDSRGASATLHVRARPLFGVFETDSFAGWRLTATSFPFSFANFSDISNLNRVVNR